MKDYGNPPYSTYKEKYYQYQDNEFGTWYIVSHGYWSGTFKEVCEYGLSVTKDPSIYKTSYFR